MTLWYLARALGFVALLAFTAATALGLLATTGDRTVAGSRARLVRQLVHRSAAIVGLLALALHAVAIATDAYVDVSLPSTLLPFTAGYRPFAVGLGTAALWAFVVTALSGAARGRLAASASGARRWRAVHAAAYAGWLLSMGHGILAGTDTRTPWAIATYAACGLAVGVACVVAVTREDVRRSPSPQGHRRLVSPGVRP